MRHQRTRLVQVVFAIFLVFVVYLFFHSASHSTNFRENTERRLKRKHSVLQGAISDEDWLDQTNKILQEILVKHREANTQIVDLPLRQGSSGQKQETRDDGQLPQDVSIAGRIKAKLPASPIASSSSTATTSKKIGGTQTQDAASEDNSEYDDHRITGRDLAKEELASILKRSPIVIFSKSYCSYSRKAKMLLLQKYNINPKPYVVELDLDMMAKDLPATAGEPSETLGSEIQILLATMTGRKTVPNVLINSQSIGGADDLLELDRQGKLIDLIKEKGGNRIVSVELKS